jgi:hypothetical protein
MPTTRRTSRRRSQVSHRPAHWDKHEVKEAFAFWIAFEALLNLLTQCGFELVHRLREAMEMELIPAVLIALMMFLFYTPASRYTLVLTSAKNYCHELGMTILNLRVGQILKHLAGHHMRAVLLWVAATASLHFAIGCAQSILHRPRDPSAVRAPAGSTPQENTPSPTASEPAALAPSNHFELMRYLGN